MRPEPTPTTERLIAKLFFEIIRTQGPFDTIAEAVDALKWRLAALRVPYHPSEFDAAVARVRGHAAIVRTTSRPGAGELLPPSSSPLSKAEAADLLDRIARRASVEQPLHQVPSAGSHEQRVREQAAAMRGTQPARRRVDSATIEAIFAEGKADAETTRTMSERAEIDQTIRWYEGGEP